MTSVARLKADDTKRIEFPERGPDFLEVLARSLRVIDALGAEGALRGDVDATLREEASIAMGQALGASTPVVCDATDLRFIDSTGVAFLLQLRMATREAGLAMSLWDPRRVVGDLLDAVGMAGEIPASDAAPGGG